MYVRMFAASKSFICTTDMLIALTKLMPHSGLNPQRGSPSPRSLGKCILQIAPFDLVVCC
jgi:hypothetical protein